MFRAFLAIYLIYITKQPFETACKIQKNTLMRTNKLFASHLQLFSLDSSQRYESIIKYWYIYFKPSPFLHTFVLLVLKS